MIAVKPQSKYSDCIWTLTTRSQQAFAKDPDFTVLEQIKYGVTLYLWIATMINCIDCLIADRTYSSESEAASEDGALIIQDDTYCTGFKSVPAKKGKQS